jgi:hypothetical protein
MISFLFQDKITDLNLYSSMFFICIAYIHF